MSESVFRVVRDWGTFGGRQQMVCNGKVHILLTCVSHAISAFRDADCSGGCVPLDLEPLSFGQAVAEYLGTATAPRSAEEPSLGKSEEPPG